MTDQPPDHLGAVAPGGIDCQAVLADVFLYLDNEGDTDVRERIRLHLDECAPCLQHYGLEQDVKKLIARCCGGDRAPDHLRTSIRVSLTTLTVDGTSVEATSVQYRRTTS